ncbi:hypothetical protein LZ023_36155 (plasmid) [Pseudomonas silvicola]|nr:hypothetical protein LZ023_36155 [Pseudomonas silvicola]
MLLFAVNLVHGDAMFDALIEAGKEFRIAVTSSNLGAIIPAVEGGLGVAMLPAELIRHDSMRLVNVAQAV